ncbi:hypothetical protein [Pseudomonas aeruginosa]|uniref:hypothetical protein n=1 Tax=Pseudomonas aeruginosa TaxID=287 RepID=UPI000BB941ED|nr:hypothetical protein [Pseudomonas aeruginosa]PBV12702.1 hypothetical protein CJU34_17670 [Pseudomonas aeruginosa]
MSMEINKALDLLREIRPSIPKEVLELWCKDRDAFLASHPAVEQAGGDERAAFEAYRDRRNALLESEGHKPGSKWHVTNAHYPTWEASRAALAQPSPAHELDPLGLAPHAEAFNEAPDEAIRPEQAERPEVVGYRSIESGMVYEQDYGLKNPEALTTVAECERIVRALRAEIAEWQEAAGRSRSDVVAYIAERAKLLEERDAALARVAELEQKSAGSWTVDTSCGRPILMYEGCSVIEDQTAYEVIRMIKWFGELEKQEPVALANRGLHAFWVKWTEAAAGLYGPGIKLYAAPVAQAQQLHDLDKQCRDDVARALGLRPNQERGFAWSYLLASIKSCVKASEDSAQAQHSVPEEFIGRLSEFLAQRGTTGKALLRELRAMLAAAPAQGGE